MGVIHGLGKRGLIPSYGYVPHTHPLLKLILAATLMASVVSFGSSWFGAFALIGASCVALYAVEGFLEIFGR